MIQFKAVKMAAAAAVLVVCATASHALTVSNVGGNEYQIDFDPITFTATSTEVAGYGFVVDGFFGANATVTGTASSGTLSVDRSTSGLFTDSGTGEPRGTFNLGVADFTPDDLLVSVGSTIFGVQLGETVTISGLGLRFTTDLLPAINSAPYSAFLVARDGSRLSADVPIHPPEVPPTARCVLLLPALGGVAVWRRRIAA